MLNKNQTPRQLSAIIAGFAALSLVVILAGLHVVQLLDISWTAIGVAVVFTFLTCYFATFFLIRFYIFRRIKLIYKIIHRHKLPSDFKAGRISMDKNILAEVEQEVNNWAEQRALNLEAEEKLASYRRRFIGDVSHELKTPIFNIQGFLHTLLDGAFEDPTVNLLYLQRAARNVDRLQSIVEDLETINKLESGQMVLDLRDFDLRDLTDEVFVDLEMRARERNIRLTYKEGAEGHFRVRADRETIHQVLQNLVVNSVKYGREGGLTKVSFYDMESYVLVEVSDNGIGIPPDHLDHVFERFYRVDKSRSRDAGGTGLGLSIVKHIIEAHKQSVTVRSNLGQGSTFGFTLEKTRG